MSILSWQLNFFSSPSVATSIQFDLMTWKLNVTAPPDGEKLATRINEFSTSCDYLTSFQSQTAVFSSKFRMAVRLLTKLKVLPDVRGSVNLSSKAAPATLSDFDVQHKTPVIRKQKLIPKAQYGGRHAVTMLPGGGIGPECMGYVRDIFK